MADTASSSCSNVQIMGPPAAASATLSSSNNKKSQITCIFETIAIHVLRIRHLVTKAIKIILGKRAYTVIFPSSQIYSVNNLHEKILAWVKIRNQVSSSMD